MRVKRRSSLETPKAAEAVPLRSVDRERAEDPALRLLLTAARLFNDHSIHGVGIDRIIAEAGVARMTLYNRFGSKEGLVRAVMERESRTWFEWVEAELARVEAPREKLEAFFTLLEQWFSRSDFKGCAFINAVGEHDRLETCIRPIAKAHREATLRYIRNLLDQMDVADPAFLADQITIIADGAIVTAMVTGNPQAARTAGLAATALIDCFSRKRDKT